MNKPGCAEIVGSVMPTRDRSRVEQVELIYINITSASPPSNNRATTSHNACDARCTALPGRVGVGRVAKRKHCLDDLSHGILKMGLIQGNQDQF